MVLGIKIFVLVLKWLGEFLLYICEIYCLWLKVGVLMIVRWIFKNVIIIRYSKCIVN